MRHPPEIRIRLLLLSVVLLSLASLRAAHADTTVPISGIGTSVAGDFAIDTHVESVTYTDPVEVVIHGMSAVEVRGTVSGTGWGGSGIVPRAESAHYHYVIPFVARWRPHCACNRLVFYNHGGGATVIAAVKRDKLSGTANPNRFAEVYGDPLIGVPALLEGATYLSINRRGMRGDGTFSATYASPVPTLTAAEVDAIEADLAAAPGPADFTQPGIAVGAPVPLVPTNDAATCRDIARALERVIAGIQGTQFRTRIGVGSSSGARLFAAFNFGRSVSGAGSVRTGGNHVVPYDRASPRIFDAFILTGFPYLAGVQHVDTEFPFSAPVIFLQGQGDERYQQHITMAHELLEQGVVLNGRVWLYETRNVTHVTRDSVYEITTGSDGDRLGCFMGAALRNLCAHLERGRMPPLSWLSGRIVDGALRFDQAGGATTNVVPFPSDPARDNVIAGPMLTPRPISSADTARWLAVTAALPHVRDAITPPSVACRLGGYRLMHFGSQLVPLSPSELTSSYGSFECYRSCVCRTVACLESQRLYDSRVESACETAERARFLFTPTSPRLAQTRR